MIANIAHWVFFFFFFSSFYFCLSYPSSFFTCDSLLSLSFLFVCVRVYMVFVAPSVCLFISQSVCLSVVCLFVCLYLSLSVYLSAILSSSPSFALRQLPPTPSPASLPVTAALEKTTFGAGSRVRPPRRDDLPPLPLTKQSPVISIAPIATEATRALPAQSSSPNSRFFRRAVELYFCLLAC